MSDQKPHIVFTALFLLIDYLKTLDRREKNETLQKELVQYRGRVQAQTKDSAKSQWSGRAMDLQRQVADLRCNVTELKKRNEELEILLNQKQLENEAKDRAIREECNAFKIRDQVTGLLKGKSDLRSNVEIKRKNQRDRDQVRDSISHLKIYIKKKSLHFHQISRSTSKLLRRRRIFNNCIQRSRRNRCK